MENSDLSKDDSPKRKEAESEFNKILPIREQILLLKERGLPEYLNQNLVEFQNKFGRLRILRDLPASNEHFHEAYELFYQIFDIIPVMYHRLSDISIFRAARNKINEVFSTQSRISYNKDITDILPGKFNVYNQSMFYGCLPYVPKKSEKYTSPVLVSSMECCKALYCKEKPLFVQDITVGRWHIKQPLDAINLCFDHFLLEKNPQLKAVTEAFFSHLKEVFSYEASLFIRDLYEYFSSLCRTGTDEKAYYVLTALFTAVKVYHETNTGTKVEALLSTSAASNGHGLNIVIMPEAVDRCLRLGAVVMYRFYLVLPEQQINFSYPCTEVVINHKALGEFDYQFKKYIPLADRFIRRHGFGDYGYPGTSL